MTMHRLTKGFVQLYTGDGKGKTSAAMGAALRAAGAAEGAAWACGRTFSSDDCSVAWLAGRASSLAAGARSVLRSPEMLPADRATSGVAVSALAAAGGSTGAAEGAAGTAGGGGALS